MQVKTWLQRLTDESNLWFNAVKAEDEGRFETAISYYMRDASQRMRDRSLVRAALSCSCAANCLTSLGAWSPARTLYAEAASIYAENSESAMSKSIREALWSLREAFENYVLAGDKTAETVRQRYVKLAGRISPFSREVKASQELESRRIESITRDVKRKETSIPEDLVIDIQNFIEAKRSIPALTSSFDPGYVMRSINTSRGSKLDEKSIAS